MSFNPFNRRDEQVRLLLCALTDNTNAIREVTKIMSTAPAGLTALTTAVSDLTEAVNNSTKAAADETSAVTAATAEIADVVAQLQANEDPAVQALATQIETQVSVINTANTNIEDQNASLSAAIATLPQPTPAPDTPPDNPAPAGS